MSPFADSKDACVAALGEVALLEEIRSWLGDAMPPAPEGMGDDCAVLSRPAGNLFAADSLLYTRHFDDTTDPARAGAKLLLRNLSDIAAMGGEPRYAVMSAFLPPATSLAWLERFCRGLAGCARQYATALVGGDITESAEGPGFSLAITGQAERPLLRSTAQPGDYLYVTGSLGGSLRGHHLTFVPRLAEGRWLADRPDTRACIDLTDGLGKDLNALLREGLGAVLDTAAVPLSDAAREAATESGKPSFWHGCNDGEDYELLFTVDGTADPAAFERAWRGAFATPLMRIGKLRARGKGGPPVLDTAGRPVENLTGYTHLRA
ncbi:MAG: thiamine-monophosphate kinase [Opitutales bacterium]|nr:thiamine-monophosphate kinase [Opitutales bacterium]